MSTDAIVLLKKDHKEVRALFKDFQSPKATTAQKGKIVKKIIELLTVHTYIENEVMYPQVRKLLPDLEDDVLESYEEHHVADVLVMELSTMAPDGRAVRRQDDGAHRERPAPHGRGGAGLVPQGPRRPGPQAAAGARRAAAAAKKARRARRRSRAR